MKHSMMKLAAQPLVWLFKLFAPIKSAWNRFYFTARLNASIEAMEYSTQCDGPVHVTGTGDIILGERCRLGMDTELRTMETGQIHMGNDVRINRGCVLTSYCQIVIDDFSLIGEYVSIRDANHGMERGSPMRYQPHDTAPIHICRDVWIGRGSCILPGVTIGEGSVIGANSVVNRDIPPYSIAAGVPAKVIKERL